MSLPTLPYIGILTDHGSVKTELNAIARAMNALFVLGLSPTSFSPIPTLPFTTILTDTGSITDVLNNLVNNINNILRNASPGTPLITTVPLVNVPPADGRDIVVAMNAVITRLNNGFSGEGSWINNNNSTYWHTFSTARGGITDLYFQESQSNPLTSGNAPVYASGSAGPLGNINALTDGVYAGINGIHGVNLFNSWYGQAPLLSNPDHIATPYTYSYLDHLHNRLLSM
jgi:hypothetical protein